MHPRQANPFCESMVPSPGQRLPDRREGIDAKEKVPARITHMHLRHELLTTPPIPGRLEISGADIDKEELTAVSLLPVVVDLPGADDSGTVIENSQGEFRLSFHSFSTASRHCRSGYASVAFHSNIGHRDFAGRLTTSR